jgi:hypothetical protein
MVAMDRNWNRETRGLQQRIATARRLHMPRRSREVLFKRLDMIEPWHTPANPPQSASEFVAVMETAVRFMDQMLGYRGSDRYVLFYYEPRGEEVVWRDSRCYGFATGAWFTFLSEVGPVAEHYDVNVGGLEMQGTHALLIDRSERRAYFPLRDEAKQFLANVAQDWRENGPHTQANPGPQIPAAMVEITQEAITRLAHEIWERKGRSEGHCLEDWLEAEAELKMSVSGRR